MIAIARIGKAGYVTILPVARIWHMYRSLILAAAISRLDAATIWIDSYWSI